MQHLAIIMDGNGRWASERGLPRTHGHLEGAAATKRAILAAKELGIKYLSLYAFSTENFCRSKSEVREILTVITNYLEDTILPLVKENNLKVRFIGEFNLLSLELMAIISKINLIGLQNDGMTVVFAIAYGGKAELTRVFNTILREKFISYDDTPIIAEEIDKYLYTANIPDPDAVVRYGGQHRLSNFMPLQTSYSELFFLDKLWPDMTKEDLVLICQNYALIRRNFGKVGDNNEE